MTSRTPRPSRAFVQYVQRDPTVCNNCFRRRYDIYVHHGKWSRERELWTPLDASNDDVPNEMPAQGTKNGCKCGHIDGTKQRPLPRPLAVEYADHIADVLARKDVTFTREVLVREVRARKQEPSNQGREDTDVFAPAVAEAIRDAKGTGIGDGPLATTVTTAD